MHWLTNTPPVSGPQSVGPKHADPQEAASTNVFFGIKIEERKNITKK